MKDVYRPELMPEPEEDMSRRMLTYIQSGKSEVARLALRWNENEILYENLPDKTDEDTIAQIQVAVVRTMVQVIASICSKVIHSHEPIVGVFSKGVTDIERGKIEDLMEYAFSQTQFGRWLRAAIVRACVQNQAVGRVVWKETLDGPMPQVEVFDCRDVLVLPNTAGRVWEKKLVLTRLTQTREDVKRLQEQGHYRKVELNAGLGLIEPETLSPELKEHRLQPTAAAEPPELEVLTLWDGVIRLPDVRNKGGERLFVVTVEESTGQILRFFPYPYAVHQFFDLMFAPATQRYWQHSGVATVLQPIQHHMSKLMNTALDAAVMQARPPVLVRGPSRMQAASLEYAPGHVYVVEGDVQPMNTGANAGILFQSTELLWQHAQRLVHVTDVDLGQALSNADTLGEVQMAQGRAGASFEEMYVEPVAEMIERVAYVMRHLLITHWDSYVEHHRASLPEIMPSDFESNFTFRVMARSIRSLPTVRMQEVLRALDVLSLGPLAVFADQYTLAREFVQTLYTPNRRSILVDEQQAAQIKEALAQSATPPVQDVPPEEMGMEASQANGAVL